MKNFFLQIFQLKQPNIPLAGTFKTSYKANPKCLFSQILCNIGFSADKRAQHGLRAAESYKTQIFVCIFCFSTNLQKPSPKNQTYIKSKIAFGWFFCSYRKRNEQIEQ